VAQSLNPATNLPYGSVIGDTLSGTVPPTPPSITSQFLSGNVGDAFNQIGFNTYGVDPAENLHEISKEKNHKVVCGFWNDDSIKKLKCNKRKSV
jgi:hypothetical protein